MRGKVRLEPRYGSIDLANSFTCLHTQNMLLKLLLSNRYSHDHDATTKPCSSRWRPVLSRYVKATNGDLKAKLIGSRSAVGARL